jgi:hypothetical protein
MPILIKKPGRYYTIREAARLTGAGVTTLAAARIAVRPEAPGAGQQAHPLALIHVQDLAVWAAGYRERAALKKSENKSRPPP